MNTHRRMRLWSLIVAHAAGQLVRVDHVCSAAISATSVDGAAVTMTLRATPYETLYASDRLAADLEDLAVTLGQGPCVDALAGVPALAADLTTSDCLAQWPVFAPAAAQAGVHAVFALPMQVGAVHVGVLNLYRARPGELDRERLADALMLADTACALLLDGDHAGQPSARGHWPERAVPQHPEVHQATGMITVQLGVTAAVALVRLRAYAYVHNRHLRDVAHDVVSRRLRFDAGSDTDAGSTSV